MWLVSTPWVFGMVVKTCPHYFRDENATIKKWYHFSDLSLVCTTNKPRERFFLYLSATQKNKLEPATSVEAEKHDNCLNGSYRGALNSRQRRANKRQRCAASPVLL